MQVLVGTNFSWKNYSKGDVPSAAIVGGKTEQGESLYIGRTLNIDDSIVGKIDGCLYIPFEGRQYAYAQFEVLVQLNNQNSSKKMGKILAWFYQN
jgi:hypothetical protein